MSATRSGEKSPTAFRTISEVSDHLEVPQHVLRFWETKFAQVRPMKRGGGRRYYRPEDVELLRRIRKLLYADGYTIKGVQKLLREGAVKLDRKSQTVELQPPVAEEPAEKQAGELSAAQRRELRAVAEELRELSRILRAASS
ncbi:MAG: MerR family transcriptional regulator [Rhodovibrionaceae bacterium]